MFICWLIVCLVMFIFCVICFVVVFVFRCRVVCRMEWWVGVSLGGMCV